jgi:PmbA protein
MVENGQGTLEDLFARVGRGFHVVSITGLHSGANPVSGEFSVGATGHLIEAGARGRPVREVTIASDLLSMLANVRDRAGDARWVPLYGSVLTPSLAIAEVALSGT